MSDLSMAEMRRIGLQRNAKDLNSGPGKSTVLSGVPFLNRLSHARSKADAAIDDNITHQQARRITQSDSLSQPHDVQMRESSLRQLLERHRRVTVGLSGLAAGTLSSVLGFATLPSSTALWIGFGCSIIAAIATAYKTKRAQPLLSARGKRRPTLYLSNRDAADIFAASGRAVSLIPNETASLSIKLNDSYGIRALREGLSDKPSKTSYSITIGYALLANLSVSRIETLITHAVAFAFVHAGKDGIRDDTLLAVETIGKKHGGPFDLFGARGRKDAQSACLYGEHAWRQTWLESLEAADQQTAKFCGVNALAEALSAQALVASGVAHPLGLEERKETTETHLTPLPDMHSLTPAQSLLGVPMSMISRLDALGTSVPDLLLPDTTPAVETLPIKLRDKADKMFARSYSISAVSPEREVRKSATEEQASTQSQQYRQSPGEMSDQASTQASGEALVREVAPAKSGSKTVQPKELSSVSWKNGEAFKKPSWLDRFKRSQTGDATLDLSSEPLTAAEILYRDDKDAGLSAFRALVETYPRWGLARLRLAEALSDRNDPAAIDLLVRSAQELPSALPTILDRLSRALSTLSPLEQEPLREAVEMLEESADTIALERSEIDLGKLSTATFDEEDTKTLTTLFKASAGLCEAWVFSSPCTWMPEVPHHAILGLALRMKPEDAQNLSTWIAEHAAIRGTVAVYLETATPEGALGDALASRPSVWHHRRA